jgi:hypothetical protein
MLAIFVSAGGLHAKRPSVVMNFISADMSSGKQKVCLKIPA